MDYSIQMYSLRDMTANDLEGALATVAKIGYKYVEFAGFFGHSAEEVNAMLDKYGLTVSGTHSSWTDLRDNFEATVAFHKAIGNKNYIIPGADLSTSEKLSEFIDVMNVAQPKLEAEGITLGYHNHSHEFIPTAEGYLIHDEIAKRTNIPFEIDTYWVYNAGLDPVAMLEKYKDRIKCIHIKDGFEGGKGMPLGKGSAPVKAVYEKAKELGFVMVVESETLTPTGADEAKVCFEYLKSIE